MRVLALLLPALFASAMTLHGQTQSIQYEMKLLRVYQNYPHNDDGGPDITWKARAIINGMGPNPIAGPTGQLHLSNMQTTGWFNVPGTPTIASGTMNYTAGNTFNLCSDNISVNLELEAWEDDCDDVFHFRTQCDGHRFGAAGNGVGNAKINPGSGVTRVFQLVNWNPNSFQNPYYGFEVSITYTLTNGIREVIYAGNAQGGPVADVCEGGNYFVFARTGPGFSGGDFEFQRSDNNGATWTTVQTGPSPAYRVTATSNPSVLYRVRLRGGFGCLGYTGNEGWMTPAGAGNLRVIPTFGASDVNISVQSSCEGDALSSITVSSINNLPPNISVTMQLNAPDDPFFVSPNPGLVTLPYTWQNLEPGRYRLNVTGVLLNGENLPTGQCTQDIFVQIAPVALPVFTGLIPTNPGCGETTGSVSAIISSYTSAFSYAWQVFAVGNTTTPVATGNQQASTVQFGNLAPGNYFVRLTVNGACVVNSDPFTIAAPPALASGTAQVVYSGAATTVLCPDGKTTVNLSAATGTGQNSVRVYFSNALNNVLASGTASPGSPFSTLLTPGDYTAVFQRNDNGCQAFVDFTVANPNNVLAVSVAATQTPANCVPLGGSLTLNVTGGLPPYTFRINGVARTPSVSGANYLFTGLPSGKGLYEVTDANGCKRKAYYTIANNAFPNLGIYGIVDPESWIITCNGGNDGWLSFHPEGGPWWLGYQVKINELDANYGPVTNWSSQNPAVRTGLTAGAYTLYAKDANGCEAARVAIIEEFPPIQITRVEIDPLYCGTSSTRVAIYATGFILRNIANGPPSILFSQDPTNPFFFGAGWTQDPSDPNGIIVYRTLFPGTYNFQLRQYKGPNYNIYGTDVNYGSYCFSNVVSVTAADFNVSTPVAVTTQIVSPTCNGETNGRITVNYTGGNPGYELQLVRFGTISPPGNPTVIQTVVLEGNAPGTYTFTNLPAGRYGVRVRTAIVDGGATNLPGSCTIYFPGDWSTNQNFTPYTLNNPAPISISNISTVTPLQCDLTGGQIRVLTVTGGTAPYRYSVNGVDFSTNNLLPALSQNTVYVRDANSCQATTTYTVTAVINPSLALSFAATPPANCVLQGLGTFTITPGTPPYKVEYATSMSGGQLVNPVIIQTSDLSLPLSGLTPGSLFVKITDAAKCVKSYTFTVPSVSASPLTAFTSARNRQTCPNINNGSLTVTAQGGTAPYQIVYDGVATTGATRSLSNLGPGTYIFDITDAAGCSTTHEVVMEAATAINHTQSYTAVGPCTDSGNGSVTISPQGGAAPYVISWLDGAPPQIVDAAGGSITRSNLNRQEYIFTIVGSGAGCSMVSSIYPPGPDVPFTAALGAVSQPQCAGVNNGSITIQATGGTGPYTYSSNGGSSFQSSATFAGLSAGTYNFIARDAAGCERTVNNVQINNVQAVSAGISTSNVLCFGQNTGSITVTPSGGLGSYTLSVNGSAPSSNLTASNLAAGNYSVVVSDVNGCLFTNPSVMVSQPAALTLNATPMPPACNGSTGSISLSATGGTGAKQYRLVGGTYSTNNVISDLAVGSYDVQVRDANGCETTLLNVQVPGPQPIVIQIQNTTPEYCNRSDGTATVSASGGTGGLSFVWSNGNNGQTATGLSVGNATVTVTDQSGCTNTQVVNITAAAGPSISGIAVQDAICTNNNGTAVVSFSGGTGTISINWSNGGMGANLSGLSAGNYTATVTDAVGCSASQMATINFVPAHTLSPAKTDENCNQGNGSITVNVSGGSGNFSYAWPAGVSATGNMASNLSGGTYVITVTDNTRGCVVTTSVNLNNTPAVTATFNVSNVLCNGQSNGSITAVPLTGTAPFFLSVNGSAPSSNLTVGGLATGTYSMVVSDVNGCTFSNPAVMVGEPAVLTLGATPAAPSCFGGNNGSIALLANGGTGTYQYRLVGGTYSANSVISNLIAGTYSVQVRDANGCETTLNNVNVMQPPAVVIQLEGTTPEFCGRADGTATVSASGGTGSLSFNWSNGQNGAIATGLAAGSYNVTATDANGCTASIQNISIPLTPPVTLGIAQLLHSLCDEGNGQITVSATGAPGPFNYTWSHNAGLNSSVAGGLNSGAYTVTVTDGNNCSAQITATVLLRPRPVLAVPVVTLAACMGNTGSVQVSVQSGGTTPFHYAWSHNAGLNSSLASNLPTGSYTCTVTDFYGCTAEVTAFVGELPPPQAMVGVTTALCSLPNGSAQVSPSGGTAPYQYTWSNGAPNSPNAQNLAAGNYTVTVTDFYGCQVVESFSVGNIPGPSALGVSFQNSICTNGVGSITVIPQGGTTPFNYVWSHNPFLNLSTASLLPGGTYSVTATDNNGCVISATQAIQFLPSPAIQTLQQKNSLCTNGNGLIEIAVTGAGPFNYIWTNGVSTGPLAQNLNVGGYTVTVTDANLCTSTRSFTIALEPAPAAQLVQITNDICGQAIGAIRINAIGGTQPINYSWSHNAGLNSNWPTGLLSGNYSVTLTDANGCTATAQYTVGGTPGPTMQLQSVSTAFCGNAVGAVSVQATGGLMPYTYSWSHNPTLNSPMAGSLLPGTYSVTVTDANNCPATVQATVPGTLLPVLTLAGISENPCVPNDVGIVMAVSGDHPPFQYAWSHNAGLNSLTANGLTSGTYTITATDVHGCQATLSATVTDLKSPEMAIQNITTSRCNANDGSISVSVGFGLQPYTFTWSHNAGLNSNTASGLAPGTYRVTVTDANGCTDQISATVTELPPPSVFVTTTTSTCSLPNGSAQSLVSGGTAPYTYLWSSGSPNSPAAPNLPAGDYTLTVTDAFGCQAVRNFSIGNIPGPTALLVSFNNSVCNNFNGSITVSPQGGSGPYSYTWSHNAFLRQPTANSLSAGTYSVTATDATGCTISATQTIEFQPPPTIQTIQQLNSLCTNGTGRIEIAVTGTGPFNYAWTGGVSTGPLAQNLNAGNYTVTVTDANGCNTTRSFAIALEPAPAIVLFSKTDDVCGQGLGAIRIRISNGLSPITLSWSHDAGLDSSWPTGLAAGDYGVTATDANGCTATAQYTIGETPGPELQVTSTTTAFCGNPVGSISVQPISGQGPYNYVWSHAPGLNSAFAGNLLPGTYSVTVTDANGCTAAATATVAGTTSPVLTLIGTNENPCLEQDATITFAIQGGSMPYVYAWSHNAALNSLTASGLASGTYTITATDANGCQVSLSASVTDRRRPALQILSLTQSTCGFTDGSASVSVSSGQAPYQFSWSHSTAVSGNTATNLPAGNYSVTITDANGCSDAISINISDSQGPQAVISQSTDAICTPDNGSMSVAVASGSAPYQFAWSHNPALNASTIVGLSPGNYSVTITDVNGCQAIASGSIGFQGPPTAMATVTNAVCEFSSGAINVQVNGGLGPYAISWNTPLLSGFNPASVFAGSYSATITDANGCQVMVSATVSFFNGPELLLVQQQNASCQQSDGSIQIGEIGGTAPYSYVWSHDPNLNFFVANGLSAGNYTVTVTDANGCTATLTTTLTDIPSAILTLSSANSLCGQSNGSITANVNGGAWLLSYSWSHNAMLNSPVATGLSPGLYSLTVTEANGCRSTATIQVSNVAGVSASVAGFTNAVCAANTGSISILASGGNGPYQFNWSHNAGLNTPTATGLTAGVYTVTVMDADGCQGVVSQTIGFTSGPQLTLTTATNTICENGNGALSFSASGGTGALSFQWSHDVNLNASSATGLQAGSYAITVTDANGCSASQSAQVIFIAGPQLSIATQTNTYCSNDAGAISLAVSGGTGPMQFAWSHDSDLESAVASGLSAGTYSATATDANGCMAMISTVISDVPGFALTAPAVQPANCSQADGAILLMPSGGQPPFQYVWSHDVDLNSAAASNLTAGLYQVTVTDAGGCTRTLSIEVPTTDGPAPAIVQIENASCGQANGSIVTTLSGGQAPYNYLWSNGSTESSISGLAGGVYRLTVTDANGCQGVLSASIAAGTAPTLQLLHADPTGCTNTVGALQFGATEGLAPYTFTWSHDAGLNNASASGLAAGTYTLTLTDAAGCTATAGGEVLVQTDLSLTLVQTQSALCTSATGSASVAGVGGQAPYSFAWSHDAGLNTGSANNLAAGNYSVTITDGAGCTAQLNLVVGLQNVILDVSVLQSSDTDCNQANGSIAAQATGGQQPYSYQWSHDAGLNSSTANNLAAGTYTFTATDANGCSGILTASISERGAPMVSVQTTNSWCDQPTGTAIVPEAGNFSYAWASTTQPGTIISTNNTATGLPAGTYNVTVTNEQGCSTIQTAQIEDLPDMALNVASVPALCFGQSNGTASVSVSGGTGPFQFVWNNGQTAASISGLSAGVYSVTATDANGCPAVGSVSVAQPAALSVNLLNSSQPTCEASVNGSIAVQVNGGTQPYGFQWDSGQQTANIGGLGAGDYLLTVTDANGCQASFQASLSAAGSLDVAVSTTAPACSGINNGTATVTTTGAFSYQWSAGGTGSSIGGLSPGTYFVTVSTADGCVAVRSFEIAAAPAIVLQTSVTPSCLNELNGTATAAATGGAGGFSYAWSNMQTGASVSNLLPGIISVTATDANGCTQSELVIVPGAPFPSLSIVNISSPDCSGQNPGAAEVLATGGTGMITYRWNDPQSQTGPSALNLSAGIYVVTATDENGCSASISVELTPPADFLLAPGAVSNPRCFGGANGSAAAVVQGGSGSFSYLWNDPAAQTGPQALNLAAGTYTVSVTDNVSGCIQITTVQLNNPPLLQLAIANTANVPCAGQSVGAATVSATGGTGSYTYLWNDPATQTGPAATNLAAGNYTVIATDANGCTVQIQIEINEPQALGAQIVNFNAPLCFGQNNGSATVAVTGGTGAYSYLWNDPALQNSATAANLAPGNYTVSIRDANNCATSVSVAIPATPAIVIAVLGQSDPVCAGDSNGSLSVSATGGTGTLSYAWSNGQSSTTLSNLPAGNYTLSVTDGNGCIQVQAFDLIPAPAIVIQLIEAVPPICANQNTGRITVAATGGALAFSYLWSNGATGAMISQLAGNQSYQVTATNAAGCSQLLAVNLPGGAVVEALGIPADTTLCADDVLKLDLSDFLTSVVSGPGGFSNNSPTVLLERAGAYRIALETIEGCRDTFAMNLNYTANVLVAGMVLPSDVVLGDSVVILETSWPAPDTVLWNFDPTRVSIIKQEQNQYWFRFSEPGRYSIGMTARQGGCQDVIYKDITVHADSSTIPSAYLGALKIVSASVNPNPGSGIFQVAVVLSGAEPLFVSLYNSNGVLVDRRRAEGLAQYSFDYDLRGQAGTYLVLVQTAQDRRTLVALVLE